MKFAIIGAGRIGRVHAQTIAAHPRAELVICADLGVDAARALAEPLGGSGTANVEDVYTHPDVDAVIICSPTAYHVEQIIRSVQAGKAVLCEKPVDLDLDRVDECIAAIAGSEHRVMIGFNRRFDPTLAEIQTRVRSGEIGSLQQLTIVSRDPAPPPIGYIAGSGGIFRDMTIHDFDLARALLGDFVDVTATGQNWDPGIKAAGDFVAAVTTMTTATGAVATIINSRHCPAGYDQRLEAFGSLGSLVAENQRSTSVRFDSAMSTDAASPYMPFFLERYAQAYRLELEHFITSIETGSTPVPSIFDGRDALVLADAATKSAGSGGRVSVLRRPATDHSERETGK